MHPHETWECCTQKPHREERPAVGHKASLHAFGCLGVEQPNGHERPILFPKDLVDQGCIAPGRKVPGRAIGWAVRLSGSKSGS